jgi:hypothetical protein
MAVERKPTKLDPVFYVDRRGLAQLLTRRGKAAVVLELFQNAVDAEAHTVTIELEPVPGRPQARLVVEDDSPTGFLDLSHAYTLFADSAKKANPEKAGRFNLGEKLVISLCSEARIETTTGTVIFGHDGRERLRSRRARGSRFEGLLAMTRAELSEALTLVNRLLVPADLDVTYNGQPLRPRALTRSFQARLQTEIADDEGFLRRRERATEVRLYEPLPNERSTLYELGIPVVETGDRFHVDVRQKLPLNLDRDNVPPGYLRTLRARVLDEAADLLDQAAAAERWVDDGLEDGQISAPAVKGVLDRRFGRKRVIYDPSDPEANKRAVAEGYTVIHGGHLSKKAFAAVRRFEAALPAGQVTPSAKPYSSDPDARARNELPESEWTEGMQAMASYARLLGRKLLGREIQVVIVDDPSCINFSATYGHGQLEFWLRRLGRAWFDQGPTDKAHALLLHEFGHEYSSDHLAAEYHRALCELGAKLARLALAEPELFRS